jgi:hypothetical protein
MIFCVPDLLTKNRGLVVVLLHELVWYGQRMLRDPRKKAKFRRHKKFRNEYDNLHISLDGQ